MLSIASRYLEYMGDINAIFKSYDIRGLYPQEIDEEVCINVGCAFAKFLLEEEQFILNCRFQGYTNSEISSFIGCGKEEVRSKVEQIITKLKARNE